MIFLQQWKTTSRKKSSSLQMLLESLQQLRALHIHLPVHLSIYLSTEHLSSSRLWDSGD